MFICFMENDSHALLLFYDLTNSKLIMYDHVFVNKLQNDHVSVKRHDSVKKLVKISYY